MREPKFRGQCLMTLEWAYGCYLTSEGLPYIYFNRSYRRVSPATVGQFTGLRDRNGREIYEGDIIDGKYNYDSDDKRKAWVIEWDEDLTGFNPLNAYDSDCDIYFDIGTCEVIGDIYENPGLQGEG